MACGGDLLAERLNQIRPTRGHHKLGPFRGEKHRQSPANTAGGPR
jgi:hypothetical protein